MQTVTWNADRWAKLEEIVDSVSQGETIGLLVGDRILEVVVKHVQDYSLDARGERC